MGASHSDLGTIGFSESSTDAATSSEGTTRIHQEIEEAEKATKILEEERLKIEQKRLEMIKEQHELAKKRLIEVKKRRKEVIGAMIKESKALQRQKELTTELKGIRRGEIQQQFIDQFVKEEHHFDEYLKDLGPNYAESVALSHETDMSSQWAIPKLGDETKVAMVWADYARIDSHLKCLEKEFEHIKANTETTLATYVEYGRRKERTMKKLDDLRKVIFQYMNEENEKERLQLIQDDPGESVYLKNGVDLRDGGVYCFYCNSKDHPGEHYCMRCLTHEHDQSECPKEVIKKVPQLGEKEATQPPKKKTRSPWALCRAVLLFCVFEML